ncbi:lysosome-associated membrane glyco 3 isoform X2 [Pelobates cultripes]|uniref:Lysosome-associated membrane glyco 3 isoform X2 n=1 Tax=Pelobates cultripes TaxID=61616 RepID=A0AAD1VTQ0_PELCU|nr:lysosome-associated membrane glyco 3 isoform X2 [Pelobates cultripes]
MARLVYICAALLFSGVLLQVTGAGDPLMATSPNTTTHAPNTTTHAPNTTTHAPNTTTHAPNITTTAPNITTTAPNTTTTAPNVTTHAPNTTTHAPNVTTHAPNVTTHAPNTTTHAPNVTTHAPNVTTHAPNVTTHAPNTTTHAPNTTTHAPNVTTHAANTTTAHHTTLPTPTLAPHSSQPASGNYTVKDEKVTCIKASMGLELQLYNSSRIEGYFDIVPETTKATGKCETDAANLNITFAEGFINFGFVRDKSGYYIKEVDVVFKLSSQTWRANSTNEKLLYTDKGYAVKCKNTPTIKFKNDLNLVMAEVKLQAFDLNNGEFGKVTSCSYDRNIIGIAVGVTVLVIIIIILIIYLIWHKKKSSGYERI